MMPSMNDQSNQILLKMDHITKKFPGVLALSKVNFDLRAGEIHILLGENGAGKSTLIKILSGVYRPDEGYIHIEGKRVHIQKPHQAKNIGISTIFQDFSLVPHLTVAQNIFLGKEISHIHSPFLLNNRSMNERCRNIMRRLEIYIEPTTYVRDLSTAEKQLVEIGRALSTDSKILIMDEPTSTLTPREIDRLFDMVLQLKQQGVGIIYISHRLEEAMKIGDRVTILRDGCFINTCRISETSIDHLISFMVGEEISERFPKENVRKGAEVLRVKHLAKAPFIEDINFSLFSGEVVGLAGLLGSGKESVLRAVAGVDPLIQGIICVNNRSASIKSTRDAINHGISYLPSDRKTEGILPRMSVGENVTLSSLKRYCHLGILHKSRERKTALEFTKKLQIRMPNIQSLLEYLSGGNQQKVIIARSLCSRSKIFCFDEPTQGIDIGAKVEIYHLLNELAKQGAAIIISSSELPELIGMCDRILAMHQGRIVRQFNRNEANQERLLRAIFGKENQN
jgi:ribose transport system ATP-binding protein